MAEYTAQLEWSRGDQDFLDKRYSRRHMIRLDGGLEIPASSSPHVVRPPFSDPAAMDPEEALVASLSSCHMLSYLYFAAQRGFRIDRYVDSAVGVMTKNEAGKFWMSVVTLRPDITFSGDKLPSREEQDEMHHLAHDECYIANSVKTDVRYEPVVHVG